MNGLMKTLGITAFAVFGSTAVACSSQESQGGDTAQHRATVSNDDGTTSLWGGKDITARLARGEQIGGPLDKRSSSRIRVANQLIERAADRSGGVLTLSMEEASPDVLEMGLHTNATKKADGVFEDLLFKAGDPFITGYIQIQNSPGLPLRAYYSVKRWVKIPELGDKAFAEQVWETGLLPDQNRPELRFGSYPFKEPLPAHWK